MRGARATRRRSTSALVKGIGVFLPACRAAPSRPAGGGRHLVSGHARRARAGGGRAPRRGRIGECADGRARRRHRAARRHDVFGRRRGARLQSRGRRGGRTSSPSSARRTSSASTASRSMTGGRLRNAARSRARRRAAAAAIDGRLADHPAESGGARPRAFARDAAAVPPARPARRADRSARDRLSDERDDYRSRRGARGCPRRPPCTPRRQHRSVALFRRGRPRPPSTRASSTASIDSTPTRCSGSSSGIPSGSEGGTWPAAAAPPLRSCARRARSARSVARVLKYAALRRNLRRQRQRRRLPCGGPVESLILTPTIAVRCYRLRAKRSDFASLAAD